LRSPQARCPRRLRPAAARPGRRRRRRRRGPRGARVGVRARPGPVDRRRRPGPGAVGGLPELVRRRDGPAPVRAASASLSAISLIPFVYPPYIFSGVLYIHISYIYLIYIYQNITAPPLFLALLPTLPPRLISISSLSSLLVSLRFLSHLPIPPFIPRFLSRISLAPSLSHLPSLSVRSPAPAQERV
jgi:hypothetical protein